jgi:hypothetical protein
MTILWSNNASGALASSISPSSTTIVLAAGQGVEFPLPAAGDYFYATLTDPSNNLEIVKVTARTADTLTVVRGQDNTAARSYAAGDLLELRPTAAALTDMQRFSTENWTITEVSGKLVFSYSGVAKFSISSVGAVIAASDVTTDDTP